MGGVLQFYQAYIKPVVRNGIPLLAILSLWQLARAGRRDRAVAPALAG